MGAGDFKQDEFSKEELAALGEAEPAAPAADKAEPVEKKAEPDTSEAEGAPTGEPKTETEPSTEDKKEIEGQGARFENGYVIDEDGEKIPLRRFREIYREAKEGERHREKWDLLKQLGPEKFYELHPDEAPAGYTPPSQRQPQQKDTLDLVAQYDNPDHEFHGLTLREIYKISPDEARKLQADYEATQRVITETRQKQQTQSLADNAREAEEFAAIVAADKFGKTDLNKLEPDEIRQINELIKDTYIWGAKNGKKGSVADMWVIRQRAEAAQSREKQEKALKSLEGNQAVRSIGSGGGSSDNGGFEAYAAMSENQLTSAIDRMNDRELKKFLKDAPASLKKKHPGLPWG